MLDTKINNGKGYFTHIYNLFSSIFSSSLKVSTNFINGVYAFIGDNFESILKSTTVAVLALSWMFSMYLSIFVFVIAMVYFIHDDNMSNIKKRAERNSTIKDHHFNEIKELAVELDKLSHWMYPVANGEKQHAISNEYRESDEYKAVSQYLNETYTPVDIDGLVQDDCSAFFPSRDALNDGEIYMFVGDNKLEPTARSISFRGTSLGRFGLDSAMLHDFDGKGPGKTSFDVWSDRLLEDALISSSEPLRTLNITGHSLGGAQAQLLFVKLLAKIDSNPTDFHDLDSINLMLFASAGVDSEVEEASHRLIKKLMRANANRDKPISINIVNHVRDYDPVPHSGKHIGASLIDPNHRDENLNIFALRHLMNVPLIVSILGGLSPIKHHKIEFFAESHRNKSKYSPLDRAAIEDDCQYYKAGGCSDDIKYMHYLFNSTRTSFVCNETLYKLLMKIKSTDLPIILSLSVFCISLMVLIRSIVLFFIAPAFISLTALLASAHYAINSGISVDNTINADRYQEMFNFSADAGFECNDSFGSSRGLVA